MMTTSEQLYGNAYAARQIDRSRSRLRGAVKSLYLDRICRSIDGPTLDFGCGAGQLLARLPEGSAGLELNPDLVQHLRARGLAVTQATGSLQDLDLGWVRPGQFRSLVMAHVLEHFESAEQALARLLAASRRVGITRVVVVVPGHRGYLSDATHRTFIDRRWLSDLSMPEGFRLAPRCPHFFPGPEWVGKWFVYHEMSFVIEALDAQPAGTDRASGSSRELTQALRFISAGAANTALSYGLYALFLRLGLHFSLASLIATVLTIFSGFLIHGRLVFGNHENSRLGRYVLVWSALYGLNLALVALLVHPFGLNAYLAGAIAILPVTAASFLLNRSYTFGGRSR